MKYMAIEIKKSFIILLSLVLLLVACAQGEAEARPPDIRYGETICEQCTMIISDARFAAGYAFEISPGRYESVAFDDIGDMLVSASEHPERAITAWYVHDYESQGWLDATRATYTLSAELPTPMGHGVAAHADRAAAERMAAALNGRVFDWNDLKAAHEADMLGGPMQEHDMEMMPPSQ